MNAVFCCLSERTPTLGYSKLNPAARGCFYRSIWFSTDTKHLSNFIICLQHVLISWLSYNTDVLYLSFQGDNCYVTSIEIQSKASGGGGSQQRALVIYEAVSFDNWCSVTAKPLNHDIWDNWVSTGFASRPRFYFGHQVAAQYHNVCFLYKGK